MGVRVFLFLMALALGSAFGAIWFIVQAPQTRVSHGAGLGAWVGCVVAAALWLALDAWRAGRFLRWVRRPDSAPMPSRFGVWGWAADYVHQRSKRSQEKLGEAERRLDSFLSAIQASPNGVILLDADMRIEWCNEAAAEHFGLDAQGDLLQPVTFLVREPVFTQYLASRKFESALIVERWTNRPVVLSVQIIPYGAGRSLMLTRDVTEKARSDAMRRDFVANVSHEIRTPLTVVAGAIETIQTLPLSEEERDHYLSMMEQQAARMQSLVNDLLTLSRLEGGPGPSDVEYVDTGAVLRRCEQEAKGLSEALHPLAEAAHDFHFEPLPGLYLIGADNELHSACANLMNNAVRYTPAGGRIGAAWRLLPDGRAEFSVTDTGSGIAPEHLPRISERFYRVDRSRSRESGGTGLGLAIAKHVAQRHGGELRIESTLGKGSRFALVFGVNRVRMKADKPG